MAEEPESMGMQARKLGFGLLEKVITSDFVLDQVKMNQAKYKKELDNAATVKRAFEEVAKANGLAGTDLENWKRDSQAFTGSQIQGAESDFRFQEAGSVRTRDFLVNASRGFNKALHSEGIVGSLARGVQTVSEFHPATMLFGGIQGLLNKGVGLAQDRVDENKGTKGMFDSAKKGESFPGAPNQKNADQSVKNVDKINQALEKLETKSDELTDTVVANNDMMNQSDQLRTDISEEQLQEQATDLGQYTSLFADTLAASNFNMIAATRALGAEIIKTKSAQFAGELELSAVKHFKDPVTVPIAIAELAGAVAIRAAGAALASSIAGGSGGGAPGGGGGTPAPAPTTNATTDTLNTDVADEETGGAAAVAPVSRGARIQVVFQGGIIDPQTIDRIGRLLSDRVQMGNMTLVASHVAGNGRQVIPTT